MWDTPFRIRLTLRVWLSDGAVSLLPAEDPAPTRLSPVSSDPLPEMDPISTSAPEVPKVTPLEAAPMPDIHTPASAPAPRVATSSKMRFVVGGLVAALMIAVVGATAFGVATNGELDTTRARLSTTEARLSTTEASLASERQSSDKLTTSNASLKAQADRQSACLNELRAEQTDMGTLTCSRYMANFNATATGSSWALAQSAQIKELDAAVGDYWKAFDAAIKGNNSAATSSASEGYAAYQRAQDAVSIMGNEIGKVNDETKAADQAWAALSGRIASTVVTCGASLPSS